MKEVVKLPFVSNVLGSELASQLNWATEQARWSDTARATRS